MKFHGTLKLVNKWAPGGQGHSYSPLNSPALPGPEHICCSQNICWINGANWIQSLPKKQEPGTSFFERRKDKISFTPHNKMPSNILIKFV